MARTHRRPITREHLLDRYANAAGITWGNAHDRAVGLGNDDLRDLVERMETTRSHGGERKSFAQSQPTTTVQGQTR